MCPMVPAWGLVVFGLDLAAAGLPLPWLAAVHLALAAATCLTWRVLGRPPLAAERAGWLALAIPFTGAIAAWALAPRVVVHAPHTIEPQGRPRLGPADLSPLPAPFRGLWELAPILRNGDIEARLGALRAIKGLEGPEGVVVLRSMLRADDHQVVLLASMALAELETDFETAIRAAREGADPALAGILRRYAESGLPPEVLVPGLWREVAAIATAPADLAAARLALGDAQGALDAAGHDPAAVLARLEALFQLGAFDRLATEARAVAAPAGSTTALVAAYWSDVDA